jgi:Cupin domain
VRNGGSDVRRSTTARSLIKRGSLVLGFALLAGAPLAAITWAEPASQVTPELITSAVFKDRFSVKTAPESPIEMQLKSKEQVRMYVRRHTYAPGGNTGWHKHPGPVFVLVTKGELTYYDYDDPECNGVPVPAGEGFVDDGHGHRVRNETGAPAEDISVIMGPPMGAFRSDLDPALSGCGS